MSQDGKLEQSRGSLGAFVEGLGEADRFEVLAFNIDPQPLFDRLEKAGAANKTAALDFLASQRASGGTQLKPALEMAWRYHDPQRPLVLVLLSDGMTEQKERAELLRLLAGRPQGVRFFAVGVGNEVNRPLLEQLANEAGGLAAFISAGDDFTRQASAFRRKLMRPAAARPKIVFEGGGTYDLEPATLPDLYHGSPLRLYGRYKEAGSAVVVLSATVDGQPIERRIPVDLPAGGQSANSDHPEIERMWASKRVDRLAKEADGKGARDTATVAEIVRLGEAFSIVTEHTSFLVLENDGEYQRWKIDRKNALRMDRDRQGAGPPRRRARKAARKGPRRARPASLRKARPRPSPGLAGRTYGDAPGGAPRLRRRPRRLTQRWRWQWWWRRRARRPGRPPDGAFRGSGRVAPAVMSQGAAILPARPSYKAWLRGPDRGSVVFLIAGRLIAPLLFAAVSLALFASPDWSAAWELRPGTPLAEPWRLLTGHFTHWTADHLQWDLLVFVALAILFPPRRLGVLLFSTALLVSLGVILLHPQLPSYRGLSGLDSALFAALAGDLLRRPNRVDRFLGALALALSPAKSPSSCSPGRRFSRRTARAAALRAPARSRGRAWRSRLCHNAPR